MKKILLTLVVCSLLSTASVASAEETQYKLLQSIPLKGTSGGETKETNASQYISGIFMLLIAIAGVLAVVMIIFGGIKYMSTDAFTEKSDAKTTIQNAIWGLALAMGAWLILFTVNPDIFKGVTLVTIPIPTDTTSGGGGRAPSAGCPNCVVLSVRHKSPPNGCLPNPPGGPCTVDAALNQKLMTLRSFSTNFLVTESYPPTRTHQNSCHSSGTCVDATISSASDANIKKFIEDAGKAGLSAQFETTSESRAAAIRQTTGLSESQVKFIPGITGEHFSVYN